ncbi:tetratricopeptide repeat protein [Limnohabitans sp. Rim8]|jgi:tetratricopeptide (TPR) repeat protein|uniref:tetratricopeptide repeat protein n=1 Tax=Limnohabitans sp. Rim8 TaxID=1100718 RepID=UPI0025EF5036|nr:tetratricopeptide repeat protein [Limnohabitans sp. Rim8]
MKFWFRLAVLSSLTLGAGAQPAAPKAASQPKSSALDAALFYQILLGELNSRQGSPGSGFSIMLDAARKTRDPALFQRSVDMALQARSGEAALQAAQTWKREIPSATEASRYVLQILLALNRVEDAGKALAISIYELPLDEQAPAMASVPRLFGMVKDKALAADVVEKALTKAFSQKATSAAAWTTTGRMRRDAGQISRAVEAASQGHAADPQATGPLVLALSLLVNANSSLKPMVDAAMKTDVTPELRLAYARTLVSLQLLPDALAQLVQLNTKHPAYPDGWLIHGLVLQESSQLPEAEKRLEQYVRMVSASKTPEHQAGLAEALMALAQIAQKQGHLDRANQWLTQMPPGADPIKLASRQAGVLAQQGRMDEARQVLAQVKTTNAEQAVRKVLAQSFWFREHRDAPAAYVLVRAALDKQPNNTELLSELSLVCEKLKRFDEMEALLRQLMALSPQEAHAFNALGYSLADRNIRLDEALQLIEKAVELAPQDAYIQDSLGWVKFRLGQQAEALAILKAAYKTKPDAEIAAHVGEVLWVMGQQGEAGTYWREGLLLKADNDTLLETLKRFNFKP